MFDALLTAALITSLGGSSGVDLEQPTWVRYRVTPGEKVIDVASRFGVSSEDVLEWNGLAPGQRRLRTGRVLRVHARRSPAPRIRTTYEVQDGDSWREIAIRFGISSRKLRSYNWARKRIEPGDELNLWLDPGQPRTIMSAGQDGSDEVFVSTVPSGGASIGLPQMGRVVGAVQLPESADYRRSRPGWAWGSTHSLRSLQRAVHGFRSETGYRGEVVVGSISRRGGGSFRPHRSHQSGRDVDIRLLVRPGAPKHRSPHADEVDWPATWRLVKALVDTGEVQRIFLERKLQPRLYEAARHDGEDAEYLSTLIEWADARRWSHAIVRHADGHAGHIHVRFRCGPRELACRER